MTHELVYTIIEDYTRKLPHSSSKELWLLLQQDDQYYEFSHVTGSNVLIIYFGKGIMSWHEMQRISNHIDPRSRPNLTIFPYSSATVSVSRDFTMQEAKDDPLKYLALAVLQCD